ncbi:MAG: 30S ribosomal protein S16 [Chitinophagales bacterium]
MPVRLRLQRHGRIRRPFYHIVAADSRVKRDGRIIERIGWYNPTVQPAQVELDREKALKWLLNGAEPTDTVRSLLKRAGVMYMKHLQRGIRKGALTEDDAAKLMEDFLTKRRKRQTAKDVRVVLVDLMEEKKSTISLLALDIAKQEVEAAIKPEAEVQEEAATETTEEETIMEKASEVVSSAVESVKETASDALEAVKEAADSVVDTISELVGSDDEDTDKEA